MSRQIHLQTIVLWATAFLFAAPLLLAQGQQQQSQQQTNPPQQQTNPPQQTQKPSLANPQQNAAPPVDPKEEAAYKAFYDMNPSTDADTDAQIKAGEQFLKDYPQSRYREGVHARLSTAYFRKGQIDQMCDEADKALAINPDDLTVLTQVGWMIPHVSPNPNIANYDQDLAKAEQYEKHALEVLNSLAKPANLTQEQFDQTKNSGLSQAHSGLGLVYFRQKKVELSSAEMSQATTVATDNDPTDFFILGLDDESLQKYADSVKAFDACAQMNSSLQERCKQGSAEAKAKAGAAPPKP